MKIAVDFDGTCVKHEYPNVGDDVPFAVVVLQSLAKQGHQLILYTMRSGQELQDAEDWFIQRGITLYSSQKDKGQEMWTQSNKCYAQVYIDDAALGCPLIYPRTGRPYVDWQGVASQLSITLTHVQKYTAKEQEEIAQLHKEAVDGEAGD